MPRKKQKPQTSFAVSFPALRAAMADLKTDDPTHFDLTCLHQKFLDEVAPAMMAGFADAQIIAALEQKAAGSAEAMTALVGAVRHIVESARTGRDGDVGNVPNMECHSSAVAGPAQIPGRMVKRRQTPKSPSPSAALPPPKPSDRDVNSESSDLGLKTPVAEVVAPEPTNGMDATPAATPTSASVSVPNSEPAGEAKPASPSLPDPKVATDKPAGSAGHSTATAEAKVSNSTKTTKPREKQTSLELSGAPQNECFSGS